jgi:hypothetical protein
VTFKNPQPIDGQKLTEIPTEWIGTYTFPADSIIAKYIVKANQIELFDQREIEFPLSNYITKDGKHYYNQLVTVEMKNTGLSSEVEKMEEVYFPVFKNDSVYAYNLEYQKFDIGKNMELIDCQNYYVLNLKYEGWLPLFLFKNDTFLDVYTFKNKSLDNFAKDEEGTITKDFTISEFSAFTRKKSKYLNTSSMHFDISKKQALNNPKHKEKN